MRSNPFIRRGLAEKVYEGEAMSIQGTCRKTLALVGVTALTALISFFVTFSSLLTTGSFRVSTTLSLISGIVGIVSIILMATNTTKAKTFSMIYAVSEGIFVGAISLRFAIYFDGVVTKALVLTLLAVIFTILLYKESPELATKIRRGVIIMTVSIVAASLVGLVFSLFGASFVFWGNGLMGIGFSVVVTGVAIANLMLDYDNIMYGARAGLPKHMEWFFATGILVTIVWVYVEILNLVAKLASRE